MVNSIKSFFGFVVFLVIGAAFFGLIWFEIHYGVAGGKFGGVEKKDMPGTFWFLIEMQTLMGLASIVTALKELWKLLHGKHHKEKYPPANLIAIYWLSASVLVGLLCILAMWSAIEMLINMYGLLEDLEMPKKAIFGCLFLGVVLVLCYLVYTLWFSSLIDTLVPKAKASFQQLLKKRKV